MGPGNWRQRQWCRRRQTVPSNQQQQRRRQQRTSNRQCFQGVGDDDGVGKDLGTTMEAAALQWRAWGIVDNNRGVGRGRWDRGLDDDDGGVGRGSRRDNAPEWTSPTAEVTVCLRSQVIDDKDGEVGGRRRAWEISDKNRGVVGGQGIDDTSEGSKTTTEASGVNDRPK